MKAFNQLKEGNKIYIYNQEQKKMYVYDIDKVCIKENGSVDIEFHDDGIIHGINILEEAISKSSVSGGGIIISTEPIQ